MSPPHKRLLVTLHATRRIPHGDSCLVQAMSVWSVKTRHAPSGHRKGDRVYRLTTALIHYTNIPPPPPAPQRNLVHDANATSAQMLEVHPARVGTVLLLEREEWSLAKSLRQATNEIRPPLSTPAAPSCFPFISPLHVSPSCFPRLAKHLPSASRLVQAQILPGWGKGRRAPSRHWKDARVYGPEDCTDMREVNSPCPTNFLDSYGVKNVTERLWRWGYLY